MRNTIQTFFFIQHQLTATVKLLCIVKARNKGRPLWPRQKWPQMNESELSGVQNLHFTLHTLNKRYLFLPWCLVLLPSLCLWERWPADGPVRRKASRKQTVWTWFHHNPSDGRWDISVWTAVLDWATFPCVEPSRQPEQTHSDHTDMMSSRETQTSSRTRSAETTAPMLRSDQTFQSWDQKTSENKAADRENRQSPRTRTLIIRRPADPRLKELL